jgi:hypothetical protein
MILGLHYLDDKMVERMMMMMMAKQTSRGRHYRSGGVIRIIEPSMEGQGG